MLHVASEVDWTFEVALLLAHETGHRIGAIRNLRWSDVDSAAQRILWRGENDKIHNRHMTPMTDVATQALKLARQLNPAIGDSWVRPSPRDASVPCSRYLVMKWWWRAEERAGVEHVEQRGWHSLRRRFAADVMDQPLKLPCDLGG